MKAFQIIHVAGDQAHQIVAPALLREQFSDVAGERGKCSGNSLPVLLMAHAAIGAEDARTELLPLESGRRAILHAGSAQPKRKRPRRERKQQTLRAAGRTALGPAVNPCCPDASFLQVGHNSQANSTSRAKEVVARAGGRCRGGRIRDNFVPPDH